MAFFLPFSLKTQKSSLRDKRFSYILFTFFMFFIPSLFILEGCQDNALQDAKALEPIPPQTVALMEQKGTNAQAPILIRTYKKEAELEIWKMRADGHYVLLKTYPLCRWSGQLGPKMREGDRQVPEGFYTITRDQMNPHSNYYLSFNIGYPNAYDRAHGASGGSIMVHGACSSAGCFSMTDQQIAEIYAIAREAFAGGQSSIQLQSLPFHMTAENFTKFRLDPNISFWKELKKGADYFEIAKSDVPVQVCGPHYVLGGTPSTLRDSTPAETCSTLKLDPAIAQALEVKEAKDMQHISTLVQDGVAPTQLVYQDGGQHPDFKDRISNVSRPETLGQEPTEVLLQQAQKTSESTKENKIQKKAENSLSSLLQATTETKAPLIAQNSPFSLEEAEKTPGLPQPLQVPLPPRRGQTTRGSIESPQRQAFLH